jgi:hypothetical protein
VAFEVDDLEAAMILHNGAPVELITFGRKKSDDDR